MSERRWGGPFSEQDLEFLSTLASRVSVAIENERLVKAPATPFLRSAGDGFEEIVVWGARTHLFGKAGDEVPPADEEKGGQLITGILSALAEALRRCEGPSQQWTRRNLRRAMVLIGGLDEKVAQGILDQEGI